MLPNTICGFLPEGKFLCEKELIIGDQRSVKGKNLADSQFEIEGFERLGRLCPIGPGKKFNIVFKD